MFPVDRVRLPARADPAHPDGPQGDGRGPLPRRPGDAGQARGPGRPRRPAHRGPCDRRRATDARSSPTAPCSTPPTWSGAPGSSRSSTGSTCRSSTTAAGRRSTAASSTPLPGLFFCGLSFQFAMSSMVFPGVGPRRRLRRPADRRSGVRSLPEVQVAGGLTRGRPAAVSSEKECCAMGVVEELVRAREAYDRREWVAAYDGLSDPSTDALTAADFARLATAAYLLGPPQRLHPGAAARLHRRHRERRRRTLRSGAASGSRWSCSTAARPRWPGAGSPARSACSTTWTRTSSSAATSWS